MKENAENMARYGFCFALPFGEHGSRLDYSSGSMEMTSDAHEPGAIVPRGPWRPVSSDVLGEIAESDTEPGPGRTVRVVSFPAGFLDRFRDLFASSDALSAALIAKMTKSPQAVALLDEFRSYVFDAQLLSEGSEIIEDGFCVRGADLETVSLDVRSGRYVGLHIDNWSRLPREVRFAGPARLCANFGWSDRFLLFVNVSFDQLVNATIDEFSSWQIDQTWKPRRGPTVFAREFLKAFPDYPIFRLRVRPGEAYIAPTENLIHDGSSLAGVIADVSCHICKH